MILLQENSGCCADATVPELTHRVNHFYTIVSSQYIRMLVLGSVLICCLNLRNSLYYLANFTMFGEKH